jgi:hypothetical protein
MAPFFKRGESPCEPIENGPHVGTFLCLDDSFSGARDVSQRGEKQNADGHQ